MFRIFARTATSNPALKMKTDRDWRRDPLFHPEIQRMDLREIADLPLAASALALAVVGQTNRHDG